ncbi:MAG TPA: glycosyltransferase family 39 protein, partial [Thermoleophilaceae bacterium]|nr:glycosyltransferase family 39 protein [Thermoleophilaceae bacterium]
ALLVRLAVVAGTPDFEPVFDAADYSRHAESIAAGDGYPGSVVTASQDEPSAFRPPAFPYLLGGVYALTGSSYTAARLLCALLGVLTVLLLFMVARRTLGPRAALVAGGIGAVFPPLVFLSASLTVESLFTPLALGAVLVLLRHRESASVRSAVAAGALIGAATLARYNGLALLLPAVLATGLGVPRSMRVRAVSAAIVCAAALAVIAPWVVRTSTAFDSPTPLGTQGGYALAGVYNSVARSDPENPGAWRLPNVAPELRGLFSDRSIDERELDSGLREESLELMGEHPGYVAEVFARNSWRLANPRAHAEETSLSYDGMGIPSGWRPLLDWSWFALLGASLAGAAAMAAGRARRPPLFIWAVPAVVLGTVAAVAAEPRYRTAADPFFALAAAALVSRAPTRDGPRAGPTSPPAPAA